MKKKQMKVGFISACVRGEGDVRVPKITGLCNFVVIW